MINEEDIIGRILYEDADHKFIWLGTDSKNRKSEIQTMQYLIIDHNRGTLRSSMPVWECSHRCQPMWDLARLERTAVDLLASGKLNVKPLIGARISFASAAEAYAIIDSAPAEKIKILLTYP